MTIPHGEPIVDDDYPQPFRWKEFNMETAIRHRNCMSRMLYE